MSAWPVITTVNTTVDNFPIAMYSVMYYSLFKYNF